MNATNAPAAEHQNIWELLPWLVNGRLGEADCRRVEAHLRICGACRAECLAQRQIYTVIRAETAVEQMPMAALNKLRQRIERTKQAVAPDAPSNQGATQSPRHAIPTRFLRPRPVAVAASVIAVSLAIGIPAAIRSNQPQQHGPAAYYTVTTAAPQHPGEVIRAVFAPTATLSELQAILDDARLKIVSGPTEAGVYSLAMTGPQSIGWSVRRLRGHDAVRFAETLAPAPVTAPPP